MEQNQHNSNSNQISGSKIGITVILNIFITVAQIIGGILSGSIALLTDALHNFSDVISLLLSYFTNRLAKKKSTIKQTYGFKRAEILSTFVNSVTLIAVAIYLIVEAVGRFLHPEPVKADLVIYFAFGSIITNFISVLLLYKDSKKSMNIKSAYLHLLTDVMTSIAVMIGGILMKYFDIYRIDSILSVTIAIYLIFASYKLLMASIKILMQFTPHDIDIMGVTNLICNVNCVKNVHHVHFWQLSDNDIFFEAHIDLEKNINITEFQDILVKIEAILYNNKITHYNIQPEYGMDDPKNLIIQH